MPCFWMSRPHPAEVNAMRLPRTWMNLVVVSFVLALAVSGCGEESKEGAFTTAPEEPVASLKSGPTLLVDESQEALPVCLGGAIALAIELDRKPPDGVDIALRALDFDEAFEVPASVRVPANEAVKIFAIRAKVDAPVGAEAEVSIVPGDRYEVGEPSNVTLTVADTALPTITIVGSEDAILSPGATGSYVLQRSDLPPTAISIPLVVEGDDAAFSVTPSPVTIAAEENDGPFEVEAIGSQGEATISFLPPVGYCLGGTPSVAVSIE